MSRTRVLFVSDNHSGHRAGLTPPAWSCEGGDPQWHTLRMQCWQWWTGIIAALQPIDVAIHVGDATEGQGKRNGGVELLTPDLEQQGDIAIAAMEPVRPKRGWHMVYGTQYHTAVDGHDFDRRVAERLGADIHDHMWLDVDGVTFDCKHHIGGSQSVNGGDSTLRNEINQAIMWHHTHDWPLCDYLIRGHVHRERVVDNCRTLPGLQLWTNYGGRRCKGVVHYGVTWCDVESKEATWHSETTIVASARPSVVTA